MVFCWVLCTEAYPPHTLIARRPEIVLYALADLEDLGEVVALLHSVLLDAEGQGYGFSSVSLAGGVLFIALILAGAAVEIVYPATLARFETFQQDAQLGFLSLALSGWMYRFAFVGMAALIAAASAVVLRTGVLPGWLAWAGFVAALVALLRFLGPLGGWLALLWVIAISVLMLTGGVESTGGPRRRTVQR